VNVYTVHYIHFSTSNIKAYDTKSGGGGSSISSRRGINALSVVMTDKQQPGKESVHMS